ncbi:MAG TPA: plastocyanin/azurin family copper-binding protein [Solirubrobacterales bacterium]|jgi:plastocyanin
MNKVAALLALALAAFILVACGGDDSDTTPTGGGETTQEAETDGQENAGGGAEGGGAGATLSFEADPEGALAYTATEATAKAGKVTVEFDNPQSLTHDVAIEDSSGKEVGATELIADSSDSTTVNLKPGTYTFFCSVPGHREAGMEGTLTVE